MNEKYDFVWRMYHQKFWIKKWVWESVGSKWITPDEYEKITGERYESKWKV